MNKELIKKVIELFKDWYEDNAEHTFDLFDRCDYVVESFMESEQAEDLLKAKEEQPKDIQEYFQEWEKENNPFYPSEMRWDRLRVNQFLSAYKTDFANSRKEVTAEQLIFKVKEITNDDTPYIELFADGSGTLWVCGSIQVEFSSKEEMISGINDYLKQLNKPL